MAPCLLPRGQNTPNRKMVVIPGAKAMGILLMASKILPNFPPWVDHNMARTDDDAGGDPADEDQGAVGRVGPQAFDNVFGRQGGGAVQGGLDGAHQRRQQPGRHQAADAVRKKLLHHHHQRGRRYRFRSSL